MPNKAEFIKFNTIKDYFKDAFKMRSSDSAVKRSISEFDSAIETVLKEAGELAQADKRNTVMDQDIISAVEKHLGKKNLTWQETAEEIIRQNPTDLGKISKAINDYIVALPIGRQTTVLCLEKEQRNNGFGHRRPNHGLVAK